MMSGWNKNTQVVPSTSIFTLIKSKYVMRNRRCSSKLTLIDIFQGMRLNSVSLDELRDIFLFFSIVCIEFKLQYLKKVLQKYGQIQFSDLEGLCLWCKLHKKFIHGTYMQLYIEAHLPSSFLSIPVTHFISYNFPISPT